MNSGPRKPAPYGYGYEKAVAMFAAELGLPRGALHVLQAILDHLNKDEGTTWASIPTLASRINAGRRTVSRHLKALEGAGVIECLGYRNGGRGRSAVWKCALPAGSTVSNYRAKMAQFSELNYAKMAENHAKMATNHAKMAPQPEKNLKRTGEESVPAGRGAVPSDAKGVCTGDVAPTGATPRPMLPHESYADARARWDREDNEALRAAENEGRVENLGAPN